MILKRQRARIGTAGTIQDLPSTASAQGSATASRGHGRLAYAAGVPKVVIDVMLKPGIHDPQGDAIASACRRLGFDQVAGVRQGKRFEVELTEATSVDRMAELAAELLANPVIEEFSIEPA